MLNLILMLALSPVHSAKVAQVAHTCQWPHRCESVAQVVQTCQYPHICADKQNSALASIVSIRPGCPVGRVCAQS